MSAAASLAALVLAAFGPCVRAPGGPARGDGPEPAVAVEWTLRRRALEAERGAPALVRELAAELAHERWSVRARALEGFARLPLTLDASTLAAVAERLDDAHPNVRARALTALRRAGAGEVPASRAVALARDALPEVRLELARLAGGGAVQDGDALLLDLAFDGDARVAAAARASLVQRGRAVLPLLERLDGEPGAWLEVVRTCARTRAWPAGEGAGARSLADELAAHIDATRDPARAAVVAALAFARGEAGDVDALAAGWLAPLVAGPTAAERRSSAEVLLEARRRDLLLRAAAEAGDALGNALLARLVAGGVDDDARAFLLEGTLLASSVEALVRGALALDAGTAVELWRRLVLRGARVDPDVLARWLAPERPPELRVAVAETLDLALRRGGDEALGQVLAALLDDPDARVRRLAFRALANAPDVRPWLDDLFRAWSRLPTDEALRLCDELPRDHAPRPFRAALLALGEADQAPSAARAPALRSSSVIELLGLFDGDAQVIAALTRWLASDLDRLTAPGGVEPGLEIRARGLVLALARAADASTADTVERALDVALAETAPVSIEVAKVVAAALGRTRGGRERLEAWLAPAVPTRVRIEAALARSAPAAGGATSDERALAVLLEHFEACDGELRRRILTRLGELADPRAIALAADVASGPHPLEEVALALATLGARAATPDVVAALRRATLEARDLETRRRAIEACGSVGGAELAALLEEAWSRWIEPRDPETAEALPPEVRDLLREELLLASARAGSAWPRVERELLVRAIASAANDLERRFAGGAGPATEFEYRSELALCEALAGAGRLASALDAADGWWRIDARLALALGARALDGAAELSDERARATRTAAARLVRLAAIGLEGEPPDEDWAVLATEARLAWMQVARDAGDWREALFAARELVRAWRADELGERTWLRVLGAADPRAGVEPRGFLEASLAQLEAHAAHAAGEHEDARRHARRAAALVGRSRRAAAEQARLDLLLATAPTVVPGDPRD